MAKLIFNNVGTDESNLIKAVGNSTDEQYVVGDMPSSQFNFIDISDSDYDAMGSGSKYLSMSEGTPTFNDVTDAFDFQTTKDNFLAHFEDYKKTLTDLVASKPNHSKITEANSALNWVNSYDTSSLADNVDSLEKQMITAGTYICLAAF